MIKNNKISSLCSCVFLGSMAIPLLLSSSLANAAGQGVLETPMGRYEFTPKSCGVHVEDGVYDIEIQGPGVSPEGEKFFFEFSSIANAITIELGVDTPFSSSDRQIKAGQYVTQEFKIEVQGAKIIVPELVFVDENYSVVEGTGSLEINCEG